MKKAKKCPICSKALRNDELEQNFHPFCSARCQKVDLDHWLGESYKIETQPSEDDLVDAMLNGEENDDDDSNLK